MRMVYLPVCKIMAPKKTGFKASVETAVSAAPLGEINH
jgi:hypothetical protein